MKKTITNGIGALVALVLFACFGSVNAQQEPFTRTDALIPMRDGVAPASNILFCS